MGITDTVMKYTTKEKGLDFIDKDGKIWGHFPQSKDGRSFTREIEIVRGELARILYELTKEEVEYVFDESITAIRQDHEGVEVDFKNGRTEIYDLLVIADGLSSRTRAMAFNQDIREPIVSLNEYIAGFSLPADKTQDGEWAKWYNSPNRRGILHRPDGFGRMRSNFIHIDYSPQTRFVCSSKTPVDQQKEYWATLFKGAGWESERLIQGMKEADDFYVYEVAQVKMKSWSKGRVVLIGDAASCPSPISGQGTNVAITQAYTLAAMITQYSDYRIAFKKYEDDLRPWVEGQQKLPPGAPRLAVPETSWGIRVLLWLAYLAAVIVRSGFVGLFSKWVGGEDKGHRLQPVEVFKRGRK
jgi:2-polyprenyl-6-methoxyphenol hydroxylase-like FAD-dependent oxidoreductase